MKFEDMKKTYLVYIRVKNLYFQKQVNFIVDTLENFLEKIYLIKSFLQF